MATTFFIIFFFFIFGADRRECNVMLTISSRQTYQDRRGPDFAASPVAVTSARGCPPNREIGRRSHVRRTTATTKVVSET